MTDLDPLATSLLQLLRERRLRLATAESCTGGLIAGALTEIAVYYSQPQPAQTKQASTDPLDRMEQAYQAALPKIAGELKLDIEEKRIWKSPAVKFAPELIDCVRQGAAQAGFSTRDMASGAGHDAAYIARVAPTTMIFVPCLGGISHNEAESTSFEECGAGSQVLLNAVLAYDRKFA